MEVILIRDVDRLGKIGEVRKVKEGFARNYLFLRNLAIPATALNLKRIEQEKRKIGNLHLREKEQALNLSNRLNGKSITILVHTHDEGKLYGSVTVSQIVNALKEDGICAVPQEAVVLDEAIKSTGVYNITIQLHPEVTTQIKVWVVKK